MNILAILATVALLIPGTAFADSVRYDKVVDVVAETSSLAARHHHHGSAGATWNITVEDRVSGRTTIIPGVPALTYLWIDPASSLVVGLSNIKLQNPYQLVVYSASGERLLEQDMRGFDWARRTESVTNWVHWYREPDPDIVVRIGKICALALVDAGGTARTFPFNFPKDRAE